MYTGHMGMLMKSEANILLKKSMKTKVYCIPGAAHNGMHATVGMQEISFGTT